MANKRPTLYVGITNNLIRRVYEHKQNLVEGFTKRYHLHDLIYYEIFDSVRRAIIRKKQLKNMNPYFKDLYPEILG